MERGGRDGYIIFVFCCAINLFHCTTFCPSDILQSSVYKLYIVCGQLLTFRVSSLRKELTRTNTRATSTDDLSSYLLMCLLRRYPCENGEQLARGRWECDDISERERWRQRLYLTGVASTARCYVTHLLLQRCVRRLHNNERRSTPTDSQT